MGTTKLLFLLLALASGGPSAQILEHKARFERGEFMTGTRLGYATFIAPGMTFESRPGRPMLPTKTMTFLLPPGTRALRAEMVDCQDEVMSTGAVPFPVQPAVPKILGKSRPFVPPEPAIYSAKAEFPGQPAELVIQGISGGYGLAVVKVSPLSYRPESKTVVLHREMTIRLTCTAAKGMVSRKNTAVLPELRSTVVNYSSTADLYASSESSRSKSWGAEVAYLIVTPSEYDTVFQRLADWKSSKGTKAEVVTTEFIYSNFSGRDEQERIRNYVKERYNNDGISYLLLGGDVEKVPTRTAFAFSTEPIGYGWDYDSLKADVYYAALDGDWDLDGDGIFGEITDSVDLYPDILVGRAPASSLEQAQTFVSKVLAYEKTPVPGYLNKASFWAEWLDANTDGGNNKDIIDGNEMTGYFKPVEKLYESLGNESRTNVLNALNNGVHLINHDGHANYDLLGIGPQYLTNADFDGLTNGWENGILYSTGCWAAAIDCDCVAEHYVNNPNGGGLAFLGNSRFGWYVPYFSGYGSSDVYDQRFFHYLLQEGTGRLGAALNTSKMDLAGLAAGENDYRWLHFCLNLLGDPELPVWTSSPDTLHITSSDTVPAGKFTFPVQVYRDGNPLAGATVCLSGDSIYTVSLTDQSGTATLTDSIHFQENLILTVTADNCLPCQKQVGTGAAGPYLTIEQVQLSEISGNGDGWPNPGEQMSATLKIANIGGQDAGPVTLSATVLNSMAKLSDSLAAMPPLEAGQSGWTSDAISFELDSSAGPGSSAVLQLMMDDGVGHVWNHNLNVGILSPFIRYQRYGINEETGNGNGTPDAGENIIINVQAANTGTAGLSGSAASLSTTDPYLSITKGEDSLYGLAPDSAGVTSFEASVSASVPGPSYFAWCRIDYLAGSKVYSDSFILSIGQTGFSDDMESGPNGWYFGSCWHQSTIEFSSPGHSWYCGSESDTLAPQGLVDTLETPSFYLGQNSTFGFRQRYGFVPGYDYGFAEIEGDFGKRTLLTVTGQSNGWEEKTFELSEYPAGSPAKVRFIVYTDYTVPRSLGWFIDDVNADGHYLGVEQEPPAVPALIGLKILSAGPNPFKTKINIQYQTSCEDEVGIKIFNLTGQLVAQDRLGQKQAGFHDFCWNGRDMRGRKLPPGVYLLNISSGNRGAFRKMVLLK